MNINNAPGNTSRATASSDVSESLPQNLVTHQTAAMKSALMVRSQYSRSAKSKFSRECLSHLKASLASVQDVSA